MWKNIVLTIWEVFFLGFSLFFMFPHVRENVFTHLDFLDFEHIWEAFTKDISGWWYLYLIFGITFAIWIPLKLWCMKESNKREKRIDETLKQLIEKVDKLNK